jgi:hypothetical protein
VSNPVSPAKFLEIFRAEGVKVVEVPGWKTWARVGHGPWGPVYGVMIHHTVSSGTARTVDMIHDGYGSLPGPLAHGMIAKDGTLYLISCGRANHAGGGDPAVLAAVKAETYAVAPPAPQFGNLDGADGNRAFYGFECENLGSGKDPWPSAQLMAIERTAAALCRYYKWKPQSVIGHKEWSNDKIDPRGFTMESMRARVARRLAGTAPAAKLYHKVIKGETLYSIGRKRGVTVDQLLRLNPTIKNFLVGVGQEVRYK